MRLDPRLLCGLVSMSLVVSATRADDLAAPANLKAAKDSREELRISLEHVAPMRLRFLESGAEIDRVEHPVLEYAAPMWGGHHGTLWVWGRRGRPVAVLEMSLVGKENLWYRSFHAVTDAPIQMTLRDGATWTPRSSNVKFQRLPGAPPPAETPAARLRQMKAFVQKFSAHQLWTWQDGDGSRHELRLLTTPVHRYEDRDQRLIDGALFIVVQGTNPEATLFLEAIQPPGETRPIWQFGVGRTSFAEQILKYDNEEVYHDPPVKFDEIFNSRNSYYRTTAKADDLADRSND